MPADAIDPQRIFNFRLSQLVSQISAPVIRLCEGRYGIARREWRILAVLARDGELSPSELATRAPLDRARTSRAISVLVDKALVERHALAGDKRRAVVRLSASGRSLVQELYPQVARINARALEVLSPAQRATLDELISVLTRHTQTFNHELVPQYHANRRAGRARRQVWTPDAAPGSADKDG